MTHISDLFSEEKLYRHIAAGHIKRRRHSDQPLEIFNYTDRAVYSRIWDEVTTQCRGLIVHAISGEVLARPFPKFFNRGEPGAPKPAPGERVHVTDKLDGSLGIMYPNLRHEGGTPYIASRGSFDSDQALIASIILARDYEDYRPPEGLTLLFEIIYPSNRIVLDYGRYSGIKLLGAVEIETGKSLRPEDVSCWTGDRTESFGEMMFRDAVHMKHRENAEGLVVHVLRSDQRIKIKQPDYLARHKVIFGLSKRSVWEHLANGGKLDAFVGSLPDEFQEWAAKVGFEMQRSVDRRVATAQRAFEMVVANLPVGFDRREFASLVGRTISADLRVDLFFLLDGRDLTTCGRPGQVPYLWKLIEPRGDEDERPC